MTTRVNPRRLLALSLAGFLFSVNIPAQVGGDAAVWLGSNDFELCAIPAAETGKKNDLCVRGKHLLLDSYSPKGAVEWFRALRTQACEGKAPEQGQEQEQGHGRAYGLTVLHTASLSAWTAAEIGAALSGIESCGQLPVLGISASRLLRTPEQLALIGQLANRRGPVPLVVSSKQSEQGVADEVAAVLANLHAAGIVQLISLNEPWAEEGIEALKAQIPTFRTVQSD